MRALFFFADALIILTIVLVIYVAYEWGKSKRKGGKTK